MLLVEATITDATYGTPKVKRPLPRSAELGPPVTAVSWAGPVVTTVCALAAETHSIDAIVARTMRGGAEIGELMKVSSAYYAPSAATVEMVEAILKDKKKILPCAVYLDGEYGIKGLFVGVPVKLGANGVEEIIQIKLTSEENAALQKSSTSVRELVTVLGL